MSIDGKKIASEIISGLKKEPRLNKFLAAILVGENPASASFLKIKEKTAKELNISFRLYAFKENIKQDELRKEVLKIAKHKTCGGVIIQLPLPEHIDKHRILNVISPEKDIDVLSERSLGAFYAGRNIIPPPVIGAIIKIFSFINRSSLSQRKMSRNASGQVSSTQLSVECWTSERESQEASETLASETSVFREINLNGKKIAIIGRGFLIGKPIALWLMNQVAELTIFTSKTENLKSKLKNFDIIISGVGKPNLFSAEDLKENTLIIDFGYSKDEKGNLVGDFNSLIQNSKFKIQNFHYTPTPGGTGPILVAQIFENFYKLNST